MAEMQRAHARFINTAAALVVAAAMLRSQDQPPPAANDLFDGRALKGHGRDQPAPLATLTGSKLERLYKGIHPERSLLLFDCASTSCWCSRPEFSFTGVFRTAAAALRLDETKLRKAWLNSGSAVLQKALGSWQGNLGDADPFQPLAIVNRMDLADVPPHGEKNPRWRNAELRFVFGRKPDFSAAKAPGFTLIFEFRLPEFGQPDFIAYANAWYAVSQASGPNYLTQLQAALKASRYTQSDFVRIRINRDQGNDQWVLAEWDLKRSALPETLSPLDEQINEKYSNNESDPTRTYLNLWKANLGLAATKASFVLPKSSPEDIYPKTAQYLFVDGTFLGTPKGLCAPPQHVRNVLAQQQCTSCHSTETCTRFMHISNRLPGSSSRLSPFLIAGADQGPTISLPSLADIYYADNKDHQDHKVIDIVSGQYATYTPDCAGTQQPFVERFHDIARRALFLSEVVLLGEHGGPADKINLAAQLSEFHTSMTH
jgi:hypothetical protein